MAPDNSRMVDVFAYKKSLKKKARRRKPRQLRLESLELRAMMTGSPFTPGDIAVVQIGTGTGALANTSTAAFIDEYTPAGVFVQSFALPTANSASGYALTLTGSATNEGELNLSTDGQDLLLTGYAIGPGSANIPNSSTSTVPRTVGEIGVSGAINTLTAVTNFANENDPRAVAGSNSQGFWLAGADATTGGIEYISGLSTTTATTTATNLTGTALKNARDVEIFNGQLYFSDDKLSANTEISALGTGLPTTGTPTISSLTGLPLANGTSTSNASTNAFFFAKVGAGADFTLNSVDSGYNTLYMADAGGGGSHDNTPGITKFSWTGSTWANDGSILTGTTTEPEGLTGVVSGTTVTLYATANGAIDSIVDSSGFGGAFSGATVTTIVAQPTNEYFAGVALTPNDGGISSITGLPGSATAYTQGAAAIEPAGSSVSFSDTASFDGGSLVVSGVGSGDTLSVASGGNISLSGTAVSYNGQQIGTLSGGVGGSLTINFDAPGNTDGTGGTEYTVTSDAVQALIQQVSFNSSGSSATGTRTITYDVSENGGVESTSNSTTVNVSAPVSGNLPAINQSLNIGVNESATPGLVTVNLSGITANGATGQTLVVTASSNNQSVVANGSISVNATPNGNGTDTLTFTPVASASGVATITVVVTDSNGSADDAFVFTAVAPPTVSAPVSQSVSKNTNHTISFGNSAVSDSFATGNITVNLADVDGTLTANGSVVGGASVSNNASGNVTLTGTPTQIDLTLAAGVVYNGGATFTGNDTLTITANDTGNTASGSAQSANATVSITVSPPTITTDIGLVTPVGATTFIYGTSGGNVTANTMLVTSDPDFANGAGTANLVYTLTSVPADGTLFSNATGNAVALANGGTFTQGDINGTTSHLYFVSNANAPAGGSDSFSFTVSDPSNNTVSGSFSITFDTPTKVGYSTPNANYTESFDGLPSAAGNGPAFGQDGPFDFVGNATSTPPQGIGSNNTLNGWSMLQSANSGITDTEKFFTDFGNAQTTGGVYSVGANNASNRALGMLGTSSNGSDVGVTLVNNTGEEINQISIAYLGEQWLSNANNNTLTFGYLVANGASLSSSGFNGFSALNYASTITSANAAENANGVPLATGNVSGTITGLDWTPGETLVLRWQIGNPGSAAGLAIDNFSFSGDSAPTLAANSGTSTAVDSSVTIGNSVLKVADSDNTDAQLTYKLTSVPTNGTLELNNNALGVNGNFTQADVDNGNLTFVAGGSTGSSSFAFTASDPQGANVSGTFDIGVGQAPLQLAHDTGITVLQGGNATISNAALQLTEAGISDDSTLVFTLGNAPTRGALKDGTVTLSSGSHFTQADIDNNLLTYTDDGAASNLTDSFTFTANDGANGTVSTSNFAITITAVPTVTTNTGIFTPAGDTTTIQGTVGGNVTSATMLITSDGSVATGNITYTLTAVPADGTLFRSSTALTVGSMFTQSDLNGSSKITFVANANATAGASDSFAFTVSDGTHTSANTTFNIKFDTPTSVSYGTAGGSYSETFDGLPSASGNGPAFVQDGPFDFVGNATAAPPQGVSSNNTLNGWSMAQFGNTSASATEKFVTDSGNAQTTGAVYSFGANGASNRSLGLVGTSSTDSEIGVTLVNTTGETLNEISIAYLGEQWTSNANLNTLAFGYLLGGSSVTGANFTADGALNYAGTVTSANAAENANGTPVASGNVSGTISGLDWTPGETLVLRWQIGATGSASGLGIDNFSFSANTTPPTFSNNALYSGSVNTQTATNGTAVATVTATPTAGDTLSGYSITAGNTGGAFAVAANGAITVANAAALAGTSYTLTVEATDGTNGTTADATVDVSVESPPVFGNATYSGSVNTQTASNGALVATVSAVGENGDTVSYSITGGDSAGTFTVDATGAITVANAAALAGSSYTLTVEATDTNPSNGDTANATVNISVASPPVFGNATYTGNVNTQTAANGTLVATVSATPDSGDAVSYSLSGVGNSAFAVAANGAITVANEAAITGTSYTLTVEATDTTNNDTANATVNITVLSPPVFANATYTLSAISGNTANGTSVGNVTATPETGDTLSYALSGTGASSFAVSNTGNITVANSPIASGNYTLTLTATDLENNDTATAHVDIDVSQISIGNQPTFTVNEKAVANATIGTFVANDSATLHYSLSNFGNTTFASDFTINANTGLISVANGAVFSTVFAAHTTSNNLPVVVTVSDGVSTVNSNVTIVESANATMAPIVTAGDANQTLTIAENSKSGGNVANISGDLSLAYTGQKLAYTLTGADAAKFKISSSGLITAVGELSYGNQSSFSVNVDVADSKNANAVSVMDLTINLTDVAPVITGANGALTVNDNKTIDPFSKLKITDTVAGQSLTATITLSGNNGNLTGNAATGATFSASTGGAYTIVGDAAAVTSTIEKLVFTPKQNQAAVGLSTDTTFTVAVDDKLGTANSTASNNVTEVGSVSINDAPTITGGGGANQAISDETTLTPFSGMTIADKDIGANGAISQTETVTVTLSKGVNGSLSLGNSTLANSVSFSSPTSGSYTFSGNTALVTTALDQLIFTPSAHEVAPGKTVATTFTVAVNDGSVTKATSNKTTSAIVTAVNDVPVVTVGNAATQTTTDKIAVTPFVSGSVSISDPDFGVKDTLTITLGNASEATLSGGNVKAVANQPGVYAVTGNMTALAADLANITLTPKQNVTAPGTVEHESLSFTVTQGSAVTAAANMTVNITSINDAPTITGTSNSAIKINDNGTTSPFTTKVKIGDVDVGQSENVTVTLSDASNGNLSMGSSTLATAVSFTSAGNGAYTFSGNAAEVTTAIQNLIFTPTDHQATPGSTVTTMLNIAVTDSGNSPTGTGNGALPATSDDKTTIAVKALDDGPTALNATIAPGLTGPVAANAVVANLAAVDADFGETFTYSITGGANKALFTIGGSSNNQLIAKSALPTGNYLVDVTVADAGGKKVVHNLTVTVGASGVIDSIA